MPSFGKTAKPRRSQETLRDCVQQTLALLDEVRAAGRVELTASEVGRVVSVGQGVVRVRGLPSVQAEELVRLHGGLLGLVYNLDPEEVGVVQLGTSQNLSAGSLAHRTGRILDVPVGDRKSVV